MWHNHPTHPNSLACETVLRPKSPALRCKGGRWWAVTALEWDRASEIFVSDHTHIMTYISHIGGWVRQNA